MVLVAAPAEQAQLEKTFSEFTQFLKEFQEQRGRRSEIAGLPVYLVISKCDLLARKDDTVSTWVQRMEEGKRKVGKRFQEFLDNTDHAPFGKIDLHLWAAAVKQPALADRPARPQEPYGVAELFRQVVDEATDFQGQRVRARRRLNFAVFGLVGVIAVMGLFAAAFYLSRPTPEVAALENAVQAALPAANAPASERWREPLEPKLKELSRIRQTPAFAQLPAHLQKQVETAIDELTSYQETSKKVDGLKRVRFFKTEEEIPAHARELSQITLPPVYAAHWLGTRLARKIQQYKSELDALAKALAVEKDWLKKKADEGDALRRMAIPAEGSADRQAWIERADAFLKRKDPSREVPGIPNMKIRDLYEFPSVSSAREDYETVRPRVDKIRSGLE